MSAAREQLWKLIFVPDLGDRAIMQDSIWELYGLAEDPNETRNVERSTQSS